MEYEYAALILNEAGEELNEENITRVLEAANVDVEESRVKALVAALEDVDIEDAIAAASTGDVPETSTPDIDEEFDDDLDEESDADHSDGEDTTDDESVEETADTDAIEPVDDEDDDDEDGGMTDLFN